MQILQMAGVATAIGGIFTLIGMILQRYWNKKDKKLTANAEVLARLDKVETTVEGFISESREREIKLARRDILRFNDEIRRGIRHTAESYDDILDTVDEYEHYCDSHPQFENNKAVLAISNIKRVYQDRLIKNDFL